MIEELKVVIYQGPCSLMGIFWCLQQMFKTSEFKSFHPQLLMYILKKI